LWYRFRFSRCCLLKIRLVLLGDHDNIAFESCFY
jgi:hypothetical protein